MVLFVHSANGFCFTDTNTNIHTYIHTYIHTHTHTHTHTHIYTQIHTTNTSLRLSCLCTTSQLSIYLLYITPTIYTISISAAGLVRFFFPFLFFLLCFALFPQCCIYGHRSHHHRYDLLRRHYRCCRHFDYQS
ncbi:unnamed protein product [Enterobius vermicularis]|uniref:Wsv094 n=1 Tax=Enterobius vermicularis TaxID=51028 RepID=A0A0N4V6A2_ENTVE|nr:unnamed protein product [Enterobius vermicularis]